MGILGPGSGQGNLHSLKCGLTYAVIDAGDAALHIFGGGGGASWRSRGVVLMRHWLKTPEPSPPERNFSRKSHTVDGAVMEPSQSGSVASSAPRSESTGFTVGSVLVCSFAAACTARSSEATLLWISLWFLSDVLALLACCQWPRDMVASPVIAEAIPI